MFCLDTRLIKKFWISELQIDDVDVFEKQSNKTGKVNNVLSPSSKHKTTMWIVSGELYKLDLLKLFHIFTTISNICFSVVMKKEIADIPVNMMGKLLDSKEANLFLQSYISYYLQKINSND